MNAGCVVEIGNMENGGVRFTNDQILACSFIENFSNLPNGRLIIKVPSMGLDELVNIPSGVNIKLKLSAFEDPDSIPDETSIRVNGTVLRHYSSSIDPQTSQGFNLFTSYVVEFIVAGENMSHLQLIKGQALLDTSLGAIKKLGKLVKTTILFDDSSIKTKDFMKWLIVNRNLVTAIDLITNRSYLSNEDALFSCFKLDGSIRIGSIRTSYDKAKAIVYNYANARFDIVNTPTKVKEGQQLIYGAFDITHSSVIKQSNASTGVARLNLPGIAGNKKDTKSQGISPTGTDSPDGINGSVVKVLSKNDPYVGGHPNTHDDYDIAPLIRNAIYSNFSHQMNIIASGESVVNVGDVINLLVPTIGSQASGSDDKVYSKVLSGKYIVNSKIYQFGDGNRFTVILGLMKSDIFYDKSKYLKMFGISEGDVK